MDTLRVGAGYSASWTVTLRYADGAPVLDVYLGTEPLDLVVCDLDGAALALAASAVTWRGVLDDKTVVTGAEAAALGLITVALDDADTAGMGPGPRGLSVGLTDGGERGEAYRATLFVEARPVG